MLKDHNAVTPVRLEPAVPQSRVKHSTTALPPFLDPHLTVALKRNFRNLFNNFMHPQVNTEKFSDINYKDDDNTSFEVLSASS